METPQRPSSSAFVLGRDTLSPHSLIALAATPRPALQVLAEDWERLESFRAKVDASISAAKTTYGINTGFGYLAQKKIPPEQLATLQLNLIRSHACGVGDPLPPTLSRALLILRAHTFLLGHSGISRGCVEKILEFLDHDLLPIVPQQGSVGASGDLAPLAHLALGLIGEGEVYYAGQRLPSWEALLQAGVSPLVPQAKEGLSLINGTHYMAVVGSQAFVQCVHLAKSADIAAALSLSGFKGSRVPFDARVARIRPHSGQTLVAANMLHLLTGPDEIMESHRTCARVQDPYSFRCVPQVHGPSRDTLSYAEAKLITELNSVSDNPLVMGNGEILSAGNFHGQALALPFDFLAIAMAEFGSISERRCDKLVNPDFSNLPAFVVRDSGLNSGFMIPHVVAAALVSENKIYAHPASVDSIPTSAEKEDHVSMGPIAAHKLLRINQNLAKILAIECLIACQALDFHRPLRPAPAVEIAYTLVRELSPFVEHDRSLHTDIEQVAAFILNGALLEGLSAEGIALR